MKYWVSRDIDDKEVYIEKSYPKSISNTFDKAVAEEFDRESLDTKEYLERNSIQCKRCGKEFIRTTRAQKFCSRDCVDKYRSIIMNHKKEGNRKFFEWLNDSTDYSYSPSKF